MSSTVLKDTIRARRRNVMLGGAGLVAAVSMQSRSAAAADKPESLPPQVGDRLMITMVLLKDELLRPELLKTGDTHVEGFPFGVADDVLRRRNRLNRLLLVRVEAGAIDADVAPMSADGVLAYSAVCTHKGCTIKAWVAETQHFRCHCHLSEFAALTGGSVQGGPARAPLPMLGLAISEEGFATVAAGFNREPGFKG